MKSAPLLPLDSRNINTGNTKVLDMFRDRLLVFLLLIIACVLAINFLKMKEIREIRTPYLPIVQKHEPQSKMPFEKKDEKKVEIEENVVENLQDPPESESKEEEGEPAINVPKGKVPGPGIKAKPGPTTPRKNPIVGTRIVSAKGKKPDQADRAGPKMKKGSPGEEPEGLESSLKCTSVKQNLPKGVQKCTFENVYVSKRNVIFYHKDGFSYMNKLYLNSNVKENSKSFLLKNDPKQRYDESVCTTIAGVDSNGIELNDLFNLEEFQETIKRGDKVCVPKLVAYKKGTLG